MKVRGRAGTVLVLSVALAAAGCISGPPVEANDANLPLAMAPVPRNVTVVSEIRGTVTGTNPLYFNPANQFGIGDRHLVQGTEGVNFNDHEFAVPEGSNRLVVTLKYDGQSVPIDTPVVSAGNVAVPDMDLEVYDADGKLVSEATSASGDIPEKAEIVIGRDATFGDWKIRAISFAGANMAYSLQIELTHVDYAGAPAIGA